MILPRTAIPRPSFLTLLVIIALAFASNAHALRIVDYSLEDYPDDGHGEVAINDSLRLILTPLQPDVVAIEEIETQTAVDSFRINVLDPINPGEWASAPYVHGNDENNCFFYRTTRWQLLGNWSFYPDAPTNYRLCDVYRMMPVGYSAPAAEVRFYVIHFQSGQTTSDNNNRVIQTAGVRDSMNAMPPGTHGILVGDFNMLSNKASQGFQKLVQNQANNTGRMIDLLNPANQTQIWDDNPAFAGIHTLSPCLQRGVDCSAGFGDGGLDERFDFFMPTLNLNDGQGLDLLTNTYFAVGNDGHHLLKNITDDPEIPEGRAYANLLQHSSEHIPIRIDLQLPAHVDVAATLDLGTVIVGGGGSLDLSNAAPPPADALSYTLSVSSGFTAPAGPFELAVEDPPASHGVLTAAGSPGPRSGTLTISSDDPDHPSVDVALTANVLAHSAPSLDPTIPQTTATLDFGDHTIGAFADTSIDVFNRGYGALQARLSLESAGIVGGGGRFSIAGGFSPALIAGDPQAEPIHFDDTGAAPDSTYQAQLTFHSRDESLPGARVQADLVVTLRARVLAGTTGSEVAGAPLATRLYSPVPNPVDRACTIRFDLARAGTASLDVFDLSGRRVAELDRRDFAPGRYSVRWNGSDDRGGLVAAGVYFLRLTGADHESRIARIVIAR
jgi:hypothetical protein